MNVNPSWIKRNLYLVITLSALLSSLLFASIMFIVFQNQTKVDQTSVGFIYLGNKETSEYADTLNLEVTVWKNSANYQVTFQEYAYQVDMSLFEFNLQETLNQIQRDRRNKAVFSISPENQDLLVLEIANLLTAGNQSVILKEKLIEDLLSDINELYSRKVYSMSHYVVSTYQESVIDQTTLINISIADADQIMQYGSELIILQNKRFSLLSELGSTPLTNTQMSIIASGLLGVSGKVNFNGFLFEQNLTLPTWADYGKNVRILRVNQFDLTFFNQSQQDLKFVIERTSDTSLSFKLMGYPTITTYSFDTEVKIAIPFQTIYLPLNTLDENTPGVIITETDTEMTYQLLHQAGVLGSVLFFNRTMTVLGEDPVVIRVFSEQYLPINEIYYQHVVPKVGD
jgi:hypothetical protein